MDTTCLHSDEKMGGSRADISIIRFFDRDVFNDEKVQICLLKLAKFINEEDTKWHMEFRGKAGMRNRADLYCNGLTLNINFQKNKKYFTVRMDKKLKDKLEAINTKHSVFLNGPNLIDTFNDFISALPVIQNGFEEYPSIQRERMMECLIAKKLNNTKKMFIADIEVVASRTSVYWNIKDYERERKNPEGDMLALLRQGGKYKFLPIEMKMADARYSVLDDAENEIRTFLNVIYGGINNLEGLFDDFKTNYENISNDKVQIGLLKHDGEKIKILDDRESQKAGLILILDDNCGKETKHRLTNIRSKELVKISKDDEMFCIYALKCTMEEFIGTDWQKGLKL